MSSLYNTITTSILQYVSDKPSVKVSELKAACARPMPNKDFYNYLFRLQKQELISKSDNSVKLSPDGKKLLQRLVPEHDNIWKLVIFDIPEKHKYVRTVLRAKLKQLHFKKWQNSIWITPYKLDEEIEQEFAELGKKFFVRLIKVSEINNTEDLQRLFKEAL